MLRLVALGEIEVEWDVFSLAIQNFDKDIAEFDPARGAGVPALRTCVLVRDTDGNEALGELYAALAKRHHHRSEDIDNGSVIVAALTDAGLDPSRYDQAVGDPATFDTLVADHRALVDRTRAFGVPAIVLDGGRGPAIFGPVISNPTEDDATALELWNHVT
ncbi:MAG: DsbA family protein, partial [Acidimicrobiia bacterium]|nr:DsbA family protein [Acidimicrobiia bacterium]